MSCFGRNQNKHETLEEVRRHLELMLSWEGWQIIETQDLGHSIVFKIRKKKVIQ